MPTSLWSWEKLLGEGTEGRDGEADTHECIRSDYTVTAGTIAAVNTSGQGSMQLSSPPQCSFDPARARATQEEFLSNWGSPTWESPSLCRVAPFMIWGVIGTQLGMFHEHETLPPLQRLHTWDGLNFNTYAWYRYDCWCQLLNLSPSHHCFRVAVPVNCRFSSQRCHVRFCHEGAPGRAPIWRMEDFFLGSSHQLPSGIAACFSL